MGKRGHNAESRNLLHQGEDSEMELFGFRTQRWRKILCTLGYIFSLGFLKLVFYWKPQWDVWAQCVPCSLDEADVVLLRTTDMFKDYTKKKVTYVYLPELMNAQTGKQGQPIISEESSTVNRAILKPHFKVRCLHVQKIRYVWDTSAQEFQKIGVLEDRYSCSELHSRFGAGFTSSEHTVRKKICGPNTIRVDIIPVWKLLFKEVLTPFYWFQAASITLWIFLGYYEYSIAIMLITLISIIITIHDLREQSVKLHNLVEAHNSVTVTVCRKDGDNKETESCHLIPGDVFLIPRKRLYLPCDAVLLNGTCIVDESMLTGESVPVSKMAVPNVDNSVPWKVHSQGDYKKHILFCGTRVLQTQGSRVGPAKAVVLQTGFNTAKGDLVRSILYSKPVSGELHRDARRFVMCLLILGFVGMIYATIVHVKHGTSAGIIVGYAVLIITVVVPPALPAGLAVGIMYAQKRLKKGGIFCISPQKITLCGWLNLICFDKTGTLTEDGLDLWGVLPSINQRFQEVHVFDSGTPLPWGPLLGAMASCHSLILLDGKVQGDPLDLKMLEGTGWRIESVGAGQNNDSSTGVIVRPGLQAAKVPVEGVAILQQFPFSSSLQRMSVVTHVIGSQEVMAFMKGAPEMVISFCRPGTVPLNFSSELELYAKQGFRIIALAYKPLQLKADCTQDLFTREEIEADLEFLGLLVLENRLKAETKPALKELTSAQIKTVMVTGDNLLTAVTVAKNSGMVSQRSKTVLVEARETDGLTPASVTLQIQESERSFEDTISDIAINSGRKSRRKLEADEYHFAMSGASYQVIAHHFRNMLPKLLLNAAVFARMSPHQKSSLIEEFQKLDYFVGMCGDGANDCGALKMAHAGVSLSEQEASVASPFTSHAPNIQCIPRLIKEGRAALVSSFCVFKFITMNCLIAFNCMMLLHWQNKFLADYQYLIQDLCISLLTLTTITLNKACPELSTRRPIRKILSLPFVVCILTHYLLNLAVLATTFVVLEQQPWVSNPDLLSECPPRTDRTFTNMTESFTYSAESYIPSFETTSMWIITSFNYIIYSFVISKGKPFRKPLYTNYAHALVLTAQILLFVCLMFTNNEAIHTALKLVCTPLIWKLALVIMLMLYFLVAYVVEEYIVDNNDFWIAMKKLWKIEAKSKYKILQRSVEKDPNWPPLNVVQQAEEINGEPGSLAVVL